MANQRGENQKLLTVPVNADFIAELDRKLPAAGYTNRSQFVRDAIIEKLKAAGIVLPKELSLSPPRSPNYPPLRRSGIHLNDKPSSKPLTEAQKIAKQAGEKYDQENPEK